MKKMDTHNSGTEMNVSQDCASTWAIGGWMWEAQTKEIDSNDSRRLDQRDNLIDTAPVYGFGVSEESSEALRREDIGKVFIATKVGLDWHNGSVRETPRPVAPEGGPRFAPSTPHELHRHLSSHWPGFGRPIEETARTMQALS